MKIIDICQHCFVVNNVFINIQHTNLLKGKRDINKMEPAYDPAAYDPTAFESYAATPMEEYNASSSIPTAAPIGEYEPQASVPEYEPSTRDYDPSSRDQGTSGRVIYFSVGNCLYPVDAKMIRDVFGKVGSPIRITVFSKDNNTQGFVEMTTEEQASSAIESLNKKFLYDGGANQLTLRITDRTCLNIGKDDTCNWDSTRPAGSGGGGGGGSGGKSKNGKGSGKGGKGGKGKGGKAPPTYQSDSYSPYPQPQGPYGGYHISSREEKAPSKNNSKGEGRPASTPVLLLSGIPTISDTLGKRVMTTDSLFVLCGCYGDVQRVRFMKEPTQALVELATVRQAECVRVHLDRLILFGSSLRVFGATNPGIRRENSDHDILKYYEYTGSKLHRFYDSRSYENMASPKPTLVVWGFPEACAPSELLTAFANYGTLESYKLGPKSGGHQLLMIQLETIDQSAVCLLNLHDFPVTAGDTTTHLRINFAKENIHEPLSDTSQTVANAIVKGLPDKFSEQDLYNLFSPYGELRRYTIWKDKATAKSKGFGLVEYTVCILHRLQ